MAIHEFVRDIPLAPCQRSLLTGVETAARLEDLIDVTMLICWGERDFVFDRHFLAEWRRRFPKAKVVAFADAGHFVLEDVRESVLGEIADFLVKHPVRALVPQS